jgi:hypothetical protein
MNSNRNWLLVFLPEWRHGHWLGCRTTQTLKQAKRIEFIRCRCLVFGTGLYFLAMIKNYTPPTPALIPTLLFILNLIMWSKSYELLDRFIDWYVGFEMLTFNAFNYLLCATAFAFRNNVFDSNKTCFTHLTGLNNFTSRGRCYDHNFLRFSPIFGEKIGVFLKKTNVMITFFIIYLCLE